MIEVNIILNQDEIFPETENIIRAIVNDAFGRYKSYDPEKVFIRKQETLNQIREAYGLPKVPSLIELNNHEPDKIQPDKLDKYKDKAPIVREYKGYIILAQSRWEERIKMMQVDKGDVIGFYKIIDEIN